MRPRNVALLAIVVGGLCLPAPLYLGWAARATAPPPRTPEVYVAEPVDLADGSDREHVVDHHATDVLLFHRDHDRSSAGVYRAPNETHRTLEAAIESGSATTDDAGARADLRAIARNDTYLLDLTGDSGRYYRLDVRENGSLVEARPVSTASVADATVDRVAVRYDELPPGERATVDRILGNSSDDPGYRPRVDDPFVDRLPALVYKDGTLYSLFSDLHVDDFGPGFAGFRLGLRVAGVGALLVLAGAGTYAVAWWRERPEG